MHVTILGSGPSGGTPLIGCECAVCKSNNPKNKRRRSSILIEKNETKILIDTSPDLRQQALDNDIKAVDAIFYSHAHADHTHGIDEVRAFNYNADAPIETYLLQKTFDELSGRFPYAFKPKNEAYGWYKPCLVPHMIAHGDVVEIGGIVVQAFSQIHGSAGETLGFRIGDFVYSTDLNELPEESFDIITGAKIWVIGCLQREPAPTHAHLELALEWINRIKPQQAILTHMGHDFEYEALLEELPNNVVPAYDNMVVKI